MEHYPQIDRGRWELVIIPETYCIDSLKAVLDYFMDLYEIGCQGHAQYPTGVFYKEV